MLARVVPGGKAWRDGYNYKESDELIRKAKDVLYGEGKGGRKSVPSMVFVGRNMFGHNYNCLSFGEEVKSQVERAGYLDSFNILSKIIKLIVGDTSFTILDWHIYENYGRLTYRVRYHLRDKGSISSQTLITVKDDGGACLLDKRGLLNQLGYKGEWNDVLEKYLMTLENLITAYFSWFGNETVPVNSLSVYRLNKLGVGEKKVYKGHGLAISENYHDVVMENPYEYRMSVFVEY